MARVAWQAQWLEPEVFFHLRLLSSQPRAAGRSGPDFAKSLISCFAHCQTCASATSSGKKSFAASGRRACRSSQSCICSVLAFLPRAELWRTVLFLFAAPRISQLAGPSPGQPRRANHFSAVSVLEVSKNLRLSSSSGLGPATLAAVVDSGRRRFHSVDALEFSRLRKGSELRIRW